MTQCVGKMCHNMLRMTGSLLSILMLLLAAIPSASALETAAPSVSPSAQPSVSPSPSPTTFSPTHSPTTNPTGSQPTQAPTTSPTHSPSFSLPSAQPSVSPSLSPTTPSPTHVPTTSPSGSPTISPTISCSAARINNAVNPSESIPLNGFARWRCRNGFKNGPSGTHRGTFRTRCTPSGGILSPEGSCVQMVCDSALISNARSATSVNVFTSLAYQCDPNYVVPNNEEGEQRINVFDIRCGFIDDVPNLFYDPNTHLCVGCRIGHACGNGTELPCAPNTFTNETRQAECRNLSSRFHVVQKNENGLRVGEIECQAGEYCDALDEDGDRYVQDCGAGYACPLREERISCTNGVNFTRTSRETSCQPCRVCAAGLNVTAPCIPRRNTICNDNVKPEIRNGTQTITLEAEVDTFDWLGLSIDDPVTAWDLQDDGFDNLTCMIVRSSPNFIAEPDEIECGPGVCGCTFRTAVNMTMLGPHVVNYTVVDESNNTAYESRTVEVQDSLPPILDFSKPNNEVVILNVTEGSFSQDLIRRYMNVTVRDARDDALGIEHNFSVSGFEDVMKALGKSPSGIAWNYTRLSAANRLRDIGWNITYSNVTDDAGNIALSLVQKFVMVDRTPPRISDLPNMSVPANRHKAHVSFELSGLDRGVTAIDFVDGNVSAYYTIASDGGFNYSKLDSYLVTYNVSDASGNWNTTECFVEVNDYIRPTLEFDDPLQEVLEIDFGSRWIEPGISADDNLDDPSDMSILVQSTSSNYSLFSAGPGSLGTTFPVSTTMGIGIHFHLNYSVKDFNNNSAQPIQRTVIVVDMSAPTFPTLDGNTSVTTITSGSTYDEECPPAEDLYDGTYTECENYNATTSSSPERQVVYRQGIDFRNSTRFSDLGPFNITYFVLDSSGNMANVTRAFVVIAPAGAESPDGNSGTIIAVVFVLLIIVAAVALGYYYGLPYYRREQTKRNNKLTPLTEFVSPAFEEKSTWPPSPEPWFHGNIDRNTAEERLKEAVGKFTMDSGLFLVRTRFSGNMNSSYALSMVLHRKLIHYTITIPEDGKGAVTIQNYPVPQKWGHNLHDVILQLANPLPHFVIPVGLSQPVLPPQVPEKIRCLFDEARHRNAGPLDVYRTITQAPKQFALNESFAITHDGIFYRLFVSPREVARSITLYQEQTGPLISTSFTVIDRKKKINPTTALFVRAEPMQLPHILGMERTYAEFHNEGVLSNASNHEIMYDSTGPASSDPVASLNATEQREVYARVHKGTGQSVSQSVAPTGPVIDTDGFGFDVGDGSTADVIYSNVVHPSSTTTGSSDSDTDGIIYTSVMNGMMSSQSELVQPDVLYTTAHSQPDSSVEGSLLYTSVNVTQTGETHPEGDIVYSSVAHSLSSETHPEGDIVYSSVAHSLSSPDTAGSSDTSEPPLPSKLSSTSTNNNSGSSSEPRLPPKLSKVGETSGILKPSQSQKNSTNTSGNTSAGETQFGFDSFTDKKELTSFQSGVQQTTKPRRVRNQVPDGQKRPSVKLEDDAPWIHPVDRTKAESILLNEGGTDGLYLIRPKGSAYAMSVILRGRFVHRLIEHSPDGAYIVDRQPGDWGRALADVVRNLEIEMKDKHGIKNFTAVLKVPAHSDEFDGFC